MESVREFYVAECSVNSRGDESFIRKSSTILKEEQQDLYRRIFRTYEEAKGMAIALAKEYPDKRFAIMEIHARVRAVPIYEIEIAV